MKWNIFVGSLVLSIAACTQSFGFDLLDRMLGSSGCGCETSCCEAKCCKVKCAKVRCCNGCNSCATVAPFVRELPPPSCVKAAPPVLLDRLHHAVPRLCPRPAAAAPVLRCGSVPQELWQRLQQMQPSLLARPHLLLQQLQQGLQ
jgi:hypothetical protein